MFKTKTQIKAMRLWKTQLAGLSTQVGERNSRLLGLCNLGARAGLSDEKIMDDILYHCGTPMLDEEEVSRAIGKARDTATEWRKPRPRLTRCRRIQSQLGPGAAIFVPRMIDAGKGATFDSLTASSPVHVHGLAPLDQTITALSHLALDGSTAIPSVTPFVFIGHQYDDAIPDKSLRPVSDWMEHFRRFKNYGRLAPLWIPNPLTGQTGQTKNGKPSYRTAACIARYRYALVEFDNLSIAEQCAFWAGVIQSNVLPVRCVTFSGGKSLHGLVEINAPDRVAWDSFIATLHERVANQSAPAEFRADRACKDPCRLSRLPGAVRADKDNAVQRLVWLS